MNKTFKVVFNKARGMLMVVNESTSSVQKKPGTTWLTAAVMATFMAAPAFAEDVVRTVIEEDTALVSSSASDVYYDVNVGTISKTEKIGTNQSAVGSNKGNRIDLKANVDSLEIVSRENMGGGANPSNRSAIYVKDSTTLTATGNEISLIAEGVAGKDIVGLKAESQSSVGITTVGDLSISAKNIVPKSSKKATLYGIYGKDSSVTAKSDKTLSVMVKDLEVDEEAVAVYSYTNSTISLSGEDVVIGVQTTQAHKDMTNRAKSVKGIRARSGTVEISGNTVSIDLGTEANTTAIQSESSKGNVSIKGEKIKISGDMALVTGNGTIDVTASEGTIAGRMSISGGSATVTGQGVDYTTTMSGDVVTVMNQGTLNLNVDKVALVTQGTNQPDVSSAAIRLDGKSVADIKAHTISLTEESSAANRAAIWLQGNTQETVAPEGTATLTLNADHIEIASKATGITAFSNSTLVANGNLNLTADGKAIDTRGNSVIKINEEGKYATKITGDIVFESPNNPSSSASSGNLINSNVNIVFAGEDSVWNGQSYQSYKKEVDGVVQDVKTSKINNGNTHNGNVIGFSVSLQNGGTWNVLGDSFVNHLELKDGGIIKVDNAVNEFNVGFWNGTDVTSDFMVSGKGNQLWLGDNTVLTGDITIKADGELLTSLTTAFTGASIDGSRTLVVKNDLAGRLHFADSEGTLVVNDSFIFTGETLTKLTDVYKDQVGLNFANATLQLNNQTSIDTKIAVSSIASNQAVSIGASGDLTLQGENGVSNIGLLTNEGKLSVVNNAQVMVDKLTGTGSINLGEENGSGAKFNVGTLAMTEGTIFVDPLYGHSTLTVGEVEDGALAVDVIGGSGALIAIGASEADVSSAAGKLGFADRTSLLYTAQSLDITSGSLHVADALTAADTAGDGQVKVGAKGALIVDQAAVGSQVFTNATNDTSVTFSDDGKLGIVNASVGTLRLADTVTGLTTEAVTTDTPFIEATVTDGVITTEVSATGGLAALASTGVQAMTRRADSILAQTIADRTSLDQEYAAGANLWVDVTGERYEADKLDNKASFKTDMGYGAFGADFTVTEDMMVGAAVQYGKGTLRSPVSSIKNSIDSYGFTAYGAMKFGDSKIVSEAAYIKNENDIASSQTALNQKLDADIYSLGIHGQHRFTAGNFQFVPSVGVRVSRLNTDSMQVGSVNIKKQEQTLVQVPIALRVNGFEQNAAGWFVSPSFRIAYVPTFGDKEISVLGLNQSVIDTSPVQGDFGIRAKKGNLMLNANFMLGGGKDGASSVGGKMGLRYVF